LGTEALRLEACILYLNMPVKLSHAGCTPWQWLTGSNPCSHMCLAPGFFLHFSMSFIVQSAATPLKTIYIPVYLYTLLRHFASEDLPPNLLPFLYCSTIAFYQKQVLAAGDGKSKKLEPYRPNAPRNRPKEMVSPAPFELQSTTCKSHGVSVLAVL